MASVPLVATETNCVDGVQPDVVPAQVSRTKAFITPLVVPPVIRFVAVDKNVTKRPSALVSAALALIEGAMLSPFAAAAPDPMETMLFAGVQPEATPVHVSLTKTFCRLPGVSVVPSVEAST